VDDIGIHYTWLDQVSVMPTATAWYALLSNIGCVLVFFFKKVSWWLAGRHAAKIAASAKRRLLVRLHASDQLHFLLLIALHTSHNFSIWAASEMISKYRPPAPSGDAEKTDGLHRC